MTEFIKVCKGSIAEHTGCQRCINCIIESKNAVKRLCKTPLNQLPDEDRIYLKTCAALLVATYGPVWLSDFIKEKK